ncbi:hypothetical protein SH528x_003846 [Novipirellula sp. SH528]|uniref:hypothetical protein n=1 Tax=Novipirellula sp. SH528 TaxID=3454466 RepID=UPI003FA0720A
MRPSKISTGSIPPQAITEAKDRSERGTGSVVTPRSQRLTIGLAVAIGREVISVEYFDSRTTAAKVWKQLTVAFAVDTTSVSQEHWSLTTRPIAFG